MVSKVLYASLFLIILLLSLAFGGENSQKVVLDLVFITLPEMPLFALTLGSAAIGILLGLLPSLILIPYLRLKITAMQNRIETLEVAPAQ